ncbi:hypothetical protein [Duganella radicis]|uniref:Uncharacterized protein n=1 Tax=Duganella radicis TaxID=551988 RepID=A0A6L6PH32_9BURK|nr:hypothetical protein [Duganella radicis]MTV38366.1 hypothetical protein [Duganella radicis]
MTLQRWTLDLKRNSGCVSPQADWWHWQQLAGSATASSPVWNARWRRQAIFQEGNESAGTKKMTLIAQTADGAWTAMTWGWTPSNRPGTRAWEQNRWDRLKQALQEMTGNEDAISSQSALGLGYRNLRNRTAEQSGNALIWQEGKLCMRIMAADKSAEPDIPLPYAREDSRLEQRAAIQVKMARGDASLAWPAAFHLMLPILPHQRSATYAAVARSNLHITGHLWLPAPTEKAVHLHIDTTLIAKQGSPEETQIVSVLNREMAAIAALWVADHER